MSVLHHTVLSLSVFLAAGLAAEQPPADELKELRAKVERLQQVDEAHEKAIRSIASEIDRRGTVILQAQNSTIYVTGDERASQSECKAIP